MVHRPDRPSSLCCHLEPTRTSTCHHIVPHPCVQVSASTWRDDGALPPVSMAAPKAVPKAVLRVRDDAREQQQGQSALARITYRETRRPLHPRACCQASALAFCCYGSWSPCARNLPLYTPRFTHHPILDIQERTSPPWRCPDISTIDLTLASATNFSTHTERTVQTRRPARPSFVSTKSHKWPHSSLT